LEHLRHDSDALRERLVAWRRDIHRHPELAFEERRTAALVERVLRETGIEVLPRIAGTGVLGILRSPEPEGPAVLLRADMDALPIQEVEGREYGSTVPGRMHACGHDGHTAMLLGAAVLLARRRERLPRHVVLCFQPAEEDRGGAERMIAEGALDVVETGSVFGLHLWSGFETAEVRVRPGPMMAGNDEFEVRIVGRGGHGALPHLARDPVVAAAQAVVALQTIVARSVDPLEPAVVTVGSIRGGSAPNVIPDAVELRGTLRSFDERVRELLRERVREVVERVSAAGGCEAEFVLREGYPAVVNDPGAVDLVRRIATRVLGAERVHETPPIAAAEDFAHFLRRRPGAFVLLGAGNVARGITAPHHSSRFDVDEDALPAGAALLAGLALAASDRVREGA